MLALEIDGPMNARSLTCWLAFAGCLLTGCRTFRPTRTVDDKVLAARELTRQGMSAMVKQHWDEAEDRLRQAVRTCPKDGAARQQYAEALWHAGRKAEAVDQMTQALEMSGNVTADSYVRLGEMHLAMQETAAAARMADKAQSHDIQSPSAWQLRGAVLERENRLPEALTAYQRVLSLAPDHQPARMAMARIYLAQRRPQRALSTLAVMESQVAEPELPSTVGKMKAAALLALDQPDRALETLEAALERTGTPDTELYQQLAQASLATGNLSRASWAVSEARRMQPDAAGIAQLDRLTSQIESQRVATAPAAGVTRR